MQHLLDNWEKKMQIVLLHISLQKILDPFCERVWKTLSLKEQMGGFLQLGFEVRKPGDQDSS